MNIGHLHVSAEATRREYAVYVMVARHRAAKNVKLYIGKTGDNREGCNPVISRVGNHLSFNPLPAQSRNHLGDPEHYDFDFFFTSFGPYVPPSRSRSGIDLVNEMERQLNFLAQETLAQETLGKIMNPLKSSRYIPPEEKDRRNRLVTPRRMDKLNELIKTVRRFIQKTSQK
jgi:hypothetical protein